MALLNIVDKYSDLSSIINLPEATSGDYIKLFFTKDGHIYTHGVDYIPWGNGQIPISKLPAGTKDNVDENHLWSSKIISEVINDRIGSSFADQDAMRFKGTMSQTVVGTTTKYVINGGTAGDFPSAEVGDTYRITSAGLYGVDSDGNAIRCEVGDLLICINDTVSPATWTVAQTNINGQIEHSINGSKWGFYSNDSESFTIYAPTSAGTTGQLLQSTGATPTWVSPTALTVGTANKTTGTLTFGEGLQATATTFNGSTNNTLKLATATATTLGGIKIGSNVTLTNGVLSLTKANVTTALGYTPDWRPIKVGTTEILGSGRDTGALTFQNGSGTSVSYSGSNLSVNVNTSYTTSGSNFAVKTDSTSGGLYVNVPQKGVVSTSADGLAPKITTTNTTLVGSTYYLLAYDGTSTLSWNKLPATAFQDTWRDVLVNNASIGTNNLKLQGSGKTTLSNSNGTVTINSTWRTVKVGNNNIGDATLRFMPSGSIYVIASDTDTTTTDTYDVSFGLAWYNLSTNTYEYE